MVLYRIELEGMPGIGINAIYPLTQNRKNGYQREFTTEFISN